MLRGGQAGTACGCRWLTIDGDRDRVTLGTENEVLGGKLERSRHQHHSNSSKSTKPILAS